MRRSTSSRRDGGGQGVTEQRLLLWPGRNVHPVAIRPQGPTGFAVGGADEALAAIPVGDNGWPSGHSAMGTHSPLVEEPSPPARFSSKTPDCLSGLGFFVALVWIVLTPIWIEGLLR